MEFTVCGGQVLPPAAPFQEPQPLRMYPLYLDGSGSVRNPTERHFVLAGVAVFERQIYHLIFRTDQFVASLDLGAVHDEEICNRFNLFLTRLWNREEEKHRGLVVMDKSHYEETLQGLARRFREEGTRWGNLRNLAEVPLFVDSNASRLIQIVDLLAWAVWRRYEHGDTRYFDRVVSRLDAEGGVIHGLVHFKPPAEECMCPACLSRARRDRT